jgi:murein DD-endopeptidase MepM/ murein hydrolase activator NlpD
VEPEPEVRVYYEKVEAGYIVYADNQAYCPVSVELDLQLKNMESLTGNQNVFVVPARSERVKLTEFRVVKPAAFGMNYDVRTKRGDHFLEAYDKNYVYYLPLNKEQRYVLSQGYNGKQTHQGKNALDFDMPEGTIVTAVRPGTVVELVENNDKGCSQEYCDAFDNYVIVYHADNTFAKYSHLRQNGVLVDLGDEVQVGQPVGESGSTGWAKGPHLHFSVFIERFDEEETIKTKFRLKAKKPNKGYSLKESKYYQRTYQ